MSLVNDYTEEGTLRCKDDCISEISQSYNVSLEKASEMYYEDLVEDIKRK